jgi:hypothetical protein
VIVYDAIKRTRTPVELSEQSDKKASSWIIPAIDDATPIDDAAAQCFGSYKALKR